MADKEYDMDPAMLKRLGIDPAPFKRKPAAPATAPVPAASAVKPAPVKTTRQEISELFAKPNQSPADIARLEMLMDKSKQEEFESFKAPAAPKKFAKGGRVTGYRGYGKAKKV